MEWVTWPFFFITEGKRHDSGMLRDSRPLDDLQRHAFSPAARPLCLYGDPAYPLRLHLQAPFRNVRLTPQMKVFNSSMSSLRTSVEWLFGDICTYFKFIDFRKDLKIGLSTVGKMYTVHENTKPSQNSNGGFILKFDANISVANIKSCSLNKTNEC